MTTFKITAAVTLAATLLAIGQASAGFPGPGGFAAPGGGGGGVAARGEIDSPGDAFYPNGAPLSLEERCHAAGGEVVIQIEDGRTFKVCII